MDVELRSCVVMNTVRAARALTRRYDARLKPYGVSVQQFSVMGALATEPGRTLGEVAAALDMDRSTLSRNLDLLARKGLARKRAADQGNARVCELTPQGRALFERLIPLWHEAQAEMRARIGPDESETYLRLLGLLAND